MRWQKPTDVVFLVRSLTVGIVGEQAWSASVVLLLPVKTLITAALESMCSL